MGSRSKSKVVDLAPAVEDLIHAATTHADPRTLRPTVEKVLDAFDDASEAKRIPALRTIGKALPQLEGRGAQILCLALGALVEAGASPEVTWPFVARDLEGLLGHATAFANAVLRQAKEEEVEVALEKAGASVAKKRPQEANAWNALPARCLAAVACLTRSKKLRANVRKDDALVAAAWPLSDVIGEVGDLLQALRIADDESLLVLAPTYGRGWRLTMDCMPSNADLYILLADLVLGDPKKGRLPGKRPEAKAIAAMREGRHPKKSALVEIPFQLVAWTAVGSDGSLPPITQSDTDHWIWAEGIPADIPKLGDERIILLQDTSNPRPLPIAPSFEALQSKLEVTEELPPGEVTRMMVKLATAATPTHSHPTTSAKKKAKKKKKQP